MKYLKVGIFTVILCNFFVNCPTKVNSTVLENETALINEDVSRLNKLTQLTNISNAHLEKTLNYESESHKLNRTERHIYTEDLLSSESSCSSIIEESNRLSMNRKRKSAKYAKTKMSCAEYSKNYNTCKRDSIDCDRRFTTCDNEYQIFMQSLKQLRDKHNMCYKIEKNCFHESKMCNTELSNCQTQMVISDKDLNSCKSNLCSCQIEAKLCDCKKHECMQDVSRFKDNKYLLEKSIGKCKIENSNLKIETGKCESLVKESNDGLEKCQKDRKLCDDKIDECQTKKDKTEFKLRTFELEWDKCKDDSSQCKTDLNECNDNLATCNNENSEIKSKCKDCKKSLSKCDSDVGDCKSNVKNCQDSVLVCNMEKDDCFKREMSCMDHVSLCIEECKNKDCCKELENCNVKKTQCDTSKNDYRASLKTCNKELEDLKSQDEQIRQICSNYYPQNIPASSYANVDGTLYFWPGFTRDYIAAASDCKARGNTLVKNDQILVSQIANILGKQGNKLTDNIVWVNCVSCLEQTGLCPGLNWNTLNVERQNCKATHYYFCEVPFFCNKYLLTNM